MDTKLFVLTFATSLSSCFGSLITLYNDCKGMWRIVSIFVVTQTASYNKSIGWYDVCFSVLDGNCPLYSSSGYRLQFLGGLNATLNSQMCYKYKLHERRHKKGLSDKVTVSMKISNNDDSANGISDYLKKVTLYNNNSNDSYYW